MSSGPSASYVGHSCSHAAGTITDFARLHLTVGEHSKEWDFLVTDIGPENVILGLPWLREANQQIDWASGVLDVEAAQRPQRVDANRKLRRAWVRASLMEEGDELWMCAGYTYSQKIAEEQHKGKTAQSLDEIIPEDYRRYANVFSVEESHRLPDHKP